MESPFKGKEDDHPHYRRNRQTALTVTAWMQRDTGMALVPAAIERHGSRRGQDPFSKPRDLSPNHILLRGGEMPRNALDAQVAVAREPGIAAVPRMGRAEGASGYSIR